MNAEPWHVGRLMDVATGYWKSALLSAGVDLGVFDRLSAGGRTADALAAEVQAPVRYLAEVLDALVALTLLEKDDEDGHYRIAPEVDAWMNRNSASCMLDALRFNMDLYPLWGNLADCVRQGKPVIPPRAHLGNDPERTRRFAMGMHSRALGVAPAILPELAPVGEQRYLDVAAGPGTFSRMLAEQQPSLRVTQFDLPPVLAVAEELTEGSPAADRIEFCAGDYHEDDLPEGFDCALLCGAVHQESEESAAALFAKVRRAIKEEGRFLLVDMMLEPDRCGPLFSNLFSINMMLTSPQGRVLTADVLTRLLYDAGFHSVELRQPAMSPYWILIARNTVASSMEDELHRKESG